MKFATVIARILLGLIFVVFGSNAFLHFLPMPPLGGYAGQFMGAMAATGYMKVVAALQVLGGLILLYGRYVPLGLTLLAPVIVNIILFHLFMGISGLPLAGLVAFLELFLIRAYWDNFRGLLSE